MKVEEAFAAYWAQIKEQHIFMPSALFEAVEPAFADNGFRTAGEIRNILLVRLDAIGDMVMTSGFIRELRRNYPLARIDMVVNPLVAPMVELCPHVDSIFTFDRKLFLQDLAACLDRMRDLCQNALWEKKYDLAICPQWGDEKRDLLLLAYMSGARERVCYRQAIGLVYYPKANIGPDAEDFQRALRFRAGMTPPELIHEVPRVMYMLKLLGLSVEDDRLEVWVSEKDQARARRWLAPYQGALLVTLGIGAGSGERKYPIEKYRVALEEIVRRYPKAVFVVLGAASEREDAAYLTAHLPADRLLNLTEQTTLRESAAVAAETALYLGNDTGLMHMAAAAGKPIIMPHIEAMDRVMECPGLYSAFARFSPWRTPAIILRPEHALDECGRHLYYGGCREKRVAHCITQIEPLTIVQAFDAMIKKMEADEV